VLKAKKMQKPMKYTIFKTKWGYFGLAATDNGLLRTCLPLAEREKAKSQLLQNLPDPQYDKALFKTAQEQITAYFEGNCIDFGGIPVVLDGLGLFTRRVLTACRDIEFGQTVSYGRLAEMAGKPGAARAVGGALAKNPLPLIIPCHRVVCANGKIGGFSTIGAVNLKKRMLKLEGADLFGQTYVSAQIFFV
jgi:methylated-DNA-[protein]-cysteine S-methyltransferase